MSIEKVDAYKNEKANRKQTLAKEKSKKKRDKIIGTTLAGAIILTFVNEFKSYQESRPNYNRTEMVVPDYTGITSESSAAE